MTATEGHESDAPAVARARVLIVGGGDLARACARAVEEQEAETTWLRRPVDRQLRAELERGYSSVVVVARDDVEALRLALLTEHLRPGLPLVVTIFDRTVAQQLTAQTSNCTVLSMADAVAPVLAQACLDGGTAALIARDGVRYAEDLRDGRPVRRPRIGSRRARRIWLAACSQLRPHDMSSRLLVVGTVGLLAVLVLDTLMVALLLGEGFVDAFYAAVKTVATVGPNPLVDEGPPWLKLASAASIIAASVLYVAFTAGLVNRLLDRRLTGIVGKRTLPRTDHVIVVGLGQVGVRLCTTLKAAGTPVVAVERNPDVPNLWLARTLGIPVVLGRGADRFLLQQMGVRRARAVAAVTSDDAENVSICVAVRALDPSVRLVLRAGDGDVSAETQALFSVGFVCDVLRLGASALALAALGRRAVVVAGPAGASPPSEDDRR